MSEKLIGSSETCIKLLEQLGIPIKRLKSATLTFEAHEPVIADCVYFVFEKGISLDKKKFEVHEIESENAGNKFFDFLEEYRREAK